MVIGVDLCGTISGNKSLRPEAADSMDTNKRAELAAIIQDDKFCKSLSASLTASIWESTVPIVAEQDGILRQHGTGTLFRIAHRYFVVTAAHVLKDAHKYDVPLRILEKEPGTKLMQVVGDFHCFKPNQGNDLYDLAVRELDQPMVDFLKGYQFVQLLDIDTKQTVEDDLYVVCGFPTKLASEARVGEPGFSLTRFFALTYPHGGSTDDLPNFDSQCHIVLDARRKFAAELIGTGPMPDNLEGISGCSIWKTNLMTVGRDKWTPAHARIIAVQTQVYPKAQLIRGTMWKVAAKLFHDAFPELQPAMALSLPQVRG